ncbi:MAG: hypothetical protein QM606_05565, partial [Leucobacter sp.]
RQAFQQALNGPMPSDEELATLEEGGELEYDWTTAGCNGAAQHQVRSESENARAAYEDPEFTELFTAQSELYGSLLGESGRHEDIVELDEEWAACMEGLGYSEFGFPLEAHNVLAAEYDRLAGSAEGEEQEIDDSALDDFREREIAVATADRDCREQIQYDERTQQIRLALEQEFVDEHREQLDALLAEYATAG